MKKRIFCMVVTLCMVISLVPVMPTFAATKGIYTYTVSDGEATITDCDDSVSGAIVIPSTLGGYPVTTIGRNAFYDCTSLTSIEIPNSVTTIGEDAFRDCESLISVEIPNSVTTIGEWAFSNCTSLTSIEIGNSVTTIGSHAFSGCDSLTSIKMGNSVTTIGKWAFYDCDSLTSIEIPDSVTTIGAYAFFYCGSLTSIEMGNSVMIIGDAAFYSCSSLTSVEIPGSVTTIGGSAFSGCESLTDVYYTGSEEQWKNISIGSGNSCLTDATIHFSGTATKYEPSTDIDIKVESDPEYMPSAINEVTINGKGTAYGRFKILNSDGTVAKNKKVYYSIDGSTKKTVSTDKYGYATIKIPQITKSRDYIVAFSGSGIQSSSGTLSVTVEPLHFRTGVESSIEKGVGVGIGGVGVELGSLEAKAGVISAGVDGGIKNTLSYEEEFVNNKHKIALSSETDYDLALAAKVGLFAEAGEENTVKVEADVAAEGEGKVSTNIGVGFEDEDFDINNPEDIENVAKFMLSSFVSTQFGNVVASLIGKMIKAPVNSYKSGSTITLKGGAHLAAIEVGNNNLKGGVTVGGLEGASIWNVTSATNADKSAVLSSGVTTNGGVDLFNVNFGVKKDEMSSSADLYKNFVKDNMNVSAEFDEESKLKKVSVSSKTVDESSVLLHKKTETENEIISYLDDAAERVAQSYDKLNDFVHLKKLLFSKKQLKKVMDTFANSEESGVFSRTKSTEKELALDLSAKFKLGLELGAKLGIAGITSYEYEAENGIFENGTYYMQAQNDIGNEVDELAITFEDMLDVAKDSINNILDSLWETAKGLADEAVEFGQAAVKKAKNTVTGWAVSITKAVSSIGSAQILAVENEAALFSTSSLATTIGEPYIINVTDKNGDEVTDFSESPFTLTLSYTEEQLAEAGVTDLDGIAVVRWDEDKCTYVKLGGTLDAENSCMTLEILKPGQYILAVDNCPPAITQFAASDNGANPEIRAIVSDMSGIEDFTFSIGEETLIDGSNMDEYYNSSTGEFSYQTENLADGEYTATIYAIDTFGNEVEKELVFVVDTTIPEISNVTEIPQIISDEVIVSAEISSETISSILLNMEATDANGNTVKNSVDMIESGEGYIGTLPKVPTGSTVNVWVSAYSASGNKAESEKQKAVVMMAENGNPVIAITKIDTGNVTVMCDEIDEIPGTKIYLAAYDENGVLTQIKAKDAEKSVIFENVSADNVLKAFLWSELAPESNFFAVTVSE